MSRIRPVIRYVGSLLTGIHNTPNVNRTITYGGHIVLFVARVENDATRDTNKLYARQGHVINIIINTFGQIVQMYFIRTDCLTSNHVGGCKFHLLPALCRLAREK